MPASPGNRLSFSLSLAFLIALLGSTLYGCGGSGSSSGSGTGAASDGSAGGSASTTTSVALSGQKGDVVVVHTLSSASRAARANASVIAVGPDAIRFVYTGYDKAGNALYGPRTEPRRATQLLDKVPVEVVRIHVDYDNVAGQHVASADIPVTVLAGGTVTVKAVASQAFTVQIVNDSGVPDSQVYVLAAANPDANGGTQSVSGVALVNTSSNTFTPAFGEQPGHGTQLTKLLASGKVASKTRPNTFETVYSFTIQNLMSGRVYLTYGDNALFVYDTKASIFNAPSANANFRWDVMELTCPAATPYPICYADLTSIQFLGIPLQLQTYADADGQQGQAQKATNSPVAGTSVAIDFTDTTGMAKGAVVTVADADNSEQATITSVTAGGIVVASLQNSYSTPYVTLDADTALQTRTFYASTPTILSALYGLTSTTDQRMQWAFQSVGNAPAPPPSPSPTPTPSCTPTSSPSATPTPSPGPNVAVRGYQSANTWLLPANVNHVGAFLRVQGPETVVAEPWFPASPSPDPTKIVGTDPNTFTQQRPYRAYPFPTFDGYVSTMVGSCYQFSGANSCGGTATKWLYGGTVTTVAQGYTMTMDPLAAMTPDATLGCGPGSSSGEALPTNLPVTVTLIPNNTQNPQGDLDFIVYSTPGGIFQVSVPCNLVPNLDNSVYANIADDALAGLQFGYVNGLSSPSDGTVWFSGFPAFPPFGAARATGVINDGLYNPYAAIIYNYSDSYGFPYSDRIAQFNPLVTTSNAGSSASSTLRVTLLNDLRPDAPTGLTLQSGADGTTVTASWNTATYNANNPTAATSYAVTISDGLPAVPAPGPKDEQTKSGLTSTTCQFSGMRPGTTYVAYVTATYPDGTTSCHSALANVLTAGTPQVVTSGSTAAAFSVTMAWDGANLSDASKFTINVAGQGSQQLQQNTPVTIPITGKVGMNFIPFTITTTDTTYPSVVPPLPGATATVVDSGAIVVKLDASGTSSFTVNTAYMTDGSPLVLPNNADHTVNYGPYSDNGGLVVAGTLAPGQKGSGTSNNVVKVVRPVFYATASPSPPATKYACTSTGYPVPTPSATPCPPMAFTPSQGLPGSQVQVTMYVNGTLQAVLFNGVPGTIVSSSPMPPPDQRTVITATVPYYNTVTGPVEVDTSFGKTVSTGIFTMIAPTFTVTPASANVGDTITLTAQGGFDFSKAASAASGSTNVVYTQGCNSAADTTPSITSTTITTKVPIGVQAGSGTVNAVFPTGLVASAPFTVLTPKFDVVPSTAVRGATVKLVPNPGSSLTDLTSVRFAGSTVNASFTKNNDGTFDVVVPQDANTGFITVTDGQFVTGTSNTTFVVNVPTITASPAAGGYGATVTLTSSVAGGLAPLPNGTITVSFGGPTNVATVDGTNTTATVTVPNGAKTGLLTITGCLAGTLTTSNTFTVTHPAIPGISPFNPMHGATGSQVIITGTGLSSATSLFFTSGGGTVPATTWTINSDTQITATVPSQATSGVVKATDATGQGSPSTATFTVP